MREGKIPVLEPCRHSREADPAGVVMTQLQGDNCNLQVSKDVTAKAGKKIFYGGREFKRSMAGYVCVKAEVE